MVNAVIIRLLNLVFFACCSAWSSSAVLSDGVSFDWATVGNPGNSGETQSQGTFGAVGYAYRISKTEVTNAQYVEFLNAVAESDPYGLYSSQMDISTQGGITRSGSSGSYIYSVKADAAGGGPGGSSYIYGNKPVVFVSWYDSVRFTNWLHNGQGNVDTESGAYTLLGGTPTPTNGLIVGRESNAKYWLPSEDEWYKAAYHNASAGTTGTYFDYATGTDSLPDNNLPTADSGNSANFRFFSFTNGNSLRPMTDVGAYTLSGGSYGTFDQSGNVREWHETLTSLSDRGFRGGGWRSTSGNLSSSVRGILDPMNENDSLGFRVARSLLLGDSNDDGVLGNDDIAAFGLALFNPTAYATAYPDVDPDVVLDMNSDGVFNNLDIAGFQSALDL